MRYAPGIRPTAYAATAAAIACAVFATTLMLIRHYGVNVPELDQFSNAALFTRIAEGSATLKDFIAQHNEQRVLFPRLVWAGLAFASDGNLIVETYANWVFAVIAFVAITLTSRCGRRDHAVDIHWWLATCLTLFAVTSWIQYGNWLFGFALLWFMQSAFVCSALALLCCAYPRRYFLRIATAGLCVAAATWSTASGMLAWLALLPCVWSWSPRPIRWRALFLWALLAAMTSSLYFVGYTSPDHVPTPRMNTLWENTGALLEHGLVMAGFPLAHTRSGAVATGAVLVIVWIGFALSWLRDAGGERGRRRAPWIALGAFALLFIGAVSVARVSLHVYAVHYKYTTTTLLLLVAVIQLVYQSLSERSEDRADTLTAGGFILAGGLSMHLIGDSVAHVAKARDYALTRSHAAVCYTLKHYAPPSCLRPLSPSPQLIRRHAGAYEALGFYDHPTQLAFIDQPEHLAGFVDAPGATESPIIVGDYGALELGGWAVPTGADTDLVFIAIDDAQTFVASARVGRVRRPDVAKAMNKASLVHSGWVLTLAANDLPEGVHTLSAWIYQPRQQSFARLRGETKIHRVTTARSN